jgi:D-alanyl-D-alanine carboxypeptidase
MSRSIGQYGIVLVFCAMLAQCQQVSGGPPPEIKNHIDALVKAANSGSSEAWEQMAQEHFSPNELKHYSAAQRKQIFDNLRRDFGTLSLDFVEGPEEPLRLHIEGSTGASGVIELSLEPDGPRRIRELAVKMGVSDGVKKSHSDVDPPLVNGNMPKEQLAEALDTYLGRLAAKDLFSGNVLIGKDGKIIYQRSYGFADRANKVPNDSATRFNLGSINKTFTQAAIQQLVARRKLSLSDTVGKLLPDYPQEATRAATIDQLLHHSAGIADFFGEQFSATAKDRFRSNADYFKFVSGLKPIFAPGARTQYCNGCYIVLGAIIERVSGLPYEQYVQENIFKAVGMKATGPLQSDGINPDVAIGYTRKAGEGPLRSNVLMHGASGCAAGGGYATAGDLLSYAMALGHGSIPDVAPEKDRGIAGGAPGINSILEQNGPWIVIVLSNLDPPAGEDVGRSLSRAFSQ